MELVVAAALLCSVATASADVELGIRTEARSSVLTPSGVPAEPRAALAAIPSAGLLLDVPGLTLEGGYAPRIWTSDAGALRSPAVNHQASLRLEAAGEGRWRGEATARASRGESEPLTDAARLAAEGVPGRPVARSPGQAATTAPLSSEELRAVAGARLDLERTVLATRATWEYTRGLGQARELLPLQRTLSGEGSVARAATERDELTLAASGRVTETDREVATDPEPDTGGRTRAAAVTGMGTWRRALSPVTSGWIGAGATVARESGESSRVLPAGEAGIRRSGFAVVLDGWARLSTLVDRFSGALAPAVEGGGGLRWTATERLEVVGTAYGGGRTDGETAFAAADLRATRAVRRGLDVHAGVVARWQREQSAERPSFFEGGVYAALSYGTGPLFAPRP